MILCEQPYPEILDAIAAELGGGSVELIFVRDEEMRQLNVQTRGIDKATDVLSFPLDPAAFAGFGEDLSEESSAHEAFKLHCLALDEGDTKLLLKKLSPTRLAAGAFRTAVEEAEAAGADAETMSRLLGKGRAKKGIFEGDLEEGELEIGQASALLSDIRPVAEIMDDLIRGYRRAADKSYKL